MYTTYSYEITQAGTYIVILNCIESLKKSVVETESSDPVSL